MIDPILICVLTYEIGDPGYDMANLERCLAALEASDDTRVAEIRVARHDDWFAIDSLVTSYASSQILLLASDTVPQAGFVSALREARISTNDMTRVYSPRVQGMLTWPPIATDWRPAARSRIPGQAVLFEGGDWTRLAPAAQRRGSEPIRVILSAADRQVMVEEAVVLSYRPDTLAHDVARSVPRFDITRCAGAVLFAATADFATARSSLAAWLEVSKCMIPEAQESLARWRAARSRLDEQTQRQLPRWIGFCDQHVEAIIHESLLCPEAVDASRDAVFRGDLKTAKSALRRFPDAYCAAVAVVSLAPESIEGHAVYEIPRVIVQGWFDSEMPADAAANVREWIRIHPDWQHRVFDSESAWTWLAANLGPEYAEIFLKAKPVAKANLFRYAFLSQEGGVWSDVDDRPRACIEELVGTWSLVVVRETNGAIGDNFIAAGKDHPVLTMARDEAFRNESDGYEEFQWLANGPGMFTRKVAAWIGALDEETASSASHRGYCVVPTSQMTEIVSLHENLEYKSTSLAWDSAENRLPSDRLYDGEIPRAQSRRQRALIDQGGGA